MTLNNMNPFDYFFMITTLLLRLSTYKNKPYTADFQIKVSFIKK